MTVEEALDFFDNLPKIRNKIQTLYDVGLGYIKLGQSATTLSGGEAQRVKLASELQKKSTGKQFIFLMNQQQGYTVMMFLNLLMFYNELLIKGIPLLLLNIT